MKQPVVIDSIIKNATIVLPDCVMVNSCLCIHDGCIVDLPDDAFRSAGSQVFDFAGDIVIPGLIDLHVHGCGGADTMDADPTAVEVMAASLLRQGTTGFLATTMSSTIGKLQEVLTVGEKIQLANDKAELLGFHMEGPCLSQSFQGAQKLDGIIDTTLPAASGVKIVTLAPELPAARTYIEWAHSIGAIVSVGHSAASYDEMNAAIAAGIIHVTHAFNAMSGIHHRVPGLLTAALLDSRVTIELIADGVHIHPAVLELALRVKGIDKVVLVSDGTRAVGMPDGEFELGGQKTFLKNGKMTLADGTIAGSASPLLTGVRLVAKVMGRPLYEAVRMATQNPAKLLKVDNRLGSLETGKEATFLRLSPELLLREVWVRGKKNYSVQSPQFKGGKMYD